MLIIKSFYYGTSYLKTGSSEGRKDLYRKQLVVPKSTAVLHKDKCYGSHELVALTSEYTQEGQKYKSLAA
jgi:hypothetical protein